ncbi:MAG: outer membrane protein transport protein [Candidatus Acinetobacter avistercoris]|uniref:OmpP1/FadL family transporter n=1 Tax=Acinetobacter sp. KS-LM10 TaxID=3120518 RepID=UPI001F965DE7|nr:outer membrane protein transport protein [Candidatus Acinetobacter avistercoris]
MKLKAISSSVLLALLPVSGVYAAALDRSGQSISAFLQPNNYFEAGISILDPSVGGITGADNGNAKVSDMAGDYYFPSAALKLQLNEQFSFGLLYDQPFGADAYYTDGGKYTGTNVEVNSNNITALVGFQPNESFNFYGGGVYQDVRGDLTLSSIGYTAQFKRDDGFGWLAGAAYQIPEIALKVSLTYRSEIDHELETNETANAIAGQIAAGIAQIQAIPAPLRPPNVQAQLAALQGVSAKLSSSSRDTKITTPQSVNLDFQTGIMANTVAFANVRWVEWGGMDIDIDKFRVITAFNGLNGGQGENIIEYKKDQWSANVGVGRKFSDQWAGNFSVGWDSGAGNPVTALGPTEGYWNIGLGAQFSPTPATFISAGVKYFMLGNADAVSAGQSVGRFEDNEALAYGLKMGYRF